MRIRIYSDWPGGGALLYFLLPIAVVLLGRCGSLADVAHPLFKARYWNQHGWDSSSLQLLEPWCH